MTANPIRKSTKPRMDSFQQAQPAAFMASCLLKKFLSCTHITKSKILYLMCQNLSNTSVCVPPMPYSVALCVSSRYSTQETLEFNKEFWVLLD